MLETDIGFYISWKIIPWTTSEILQSKIKLLDGNYSWELSNIEADVLLTIPKLWEDSSKIFAKSSSAFEWWTNDFIKIVRQEDIDNAKISILDSIARNDLKKENGEYEYIQELEEPLRVKATTEIEYYISKNFENQDNYFSHKLKNSISGMNIDDAEDFLVNLPQINNVKIRIQPFFLDTISKIPDNIIITVLD